MATTNTQASTQIKIAQLKALGFDDEYHAPPRRLIVSSGGREKTGKSNFALTAPEPIIYFNIDIGAEGVVDKFQASGKQVLVYDVRVPKTAGKDTYEPMWKNLQMLLGKAYELGEGTVVIDTDTEAYELARLAKLGKLTQVMPHNYVDVNNEYREILRQAYDSTMNTIFIHKMKPKWINNARTNEYEVSGMGDIDYLAQVNILHYREDTDEDTVFSVYVKDCRQRPGVAGTVLRGLPLPKGDVRVGDPLCNFDMLMGMVLD